MDRYDRLYRRYDRLYRQFLLCRIALIGMIGVVLLLSFAYATRFYLDRGQATVDTRGATFIPKSCQSS